MGSNLSNCTDCMVECLWFCLFLIRMHSTVIYLCPGPKLVYEMGVFHVEIDQLLCIGSFRRIFLQNPKVWKIRKK